MTTSAAQANARYVAALRRADGGVPGPLGEFLARAVLDNLYKFVVPAVAGPARLVPSPQGGQGVGRHVAKLEGVGR